MTDATSTICTCDCLDCASRERHVLHNGPPAPPAEAVVRDERDPWISSVIEGGAPTESELRVMDGNR